MKLHYSQTREAIVVPSPMFYYLMKLHYSQTPQHCWRGKNLFYYLMKLHYSQTGVDQVIMVACFTTLWNYTTLKLVRTVHGHAQGFTTLWNYTTLKLVNRERLVGGVLLPYEITLLSNDSRFSDRRPLFYYLMKLHYSQTRCRKTIWPCQFYYLMKLHYSQTCSCCGAEAQVLLPYEITLLSNLKWE